MMFARHFLSSVTWTGQKYLQKNTAWYYRIIGRKQMCNVYNKVADKTAGGGKHEKCKS